MDGFSFVTSVTGLNRRNTGKKKKKMMMRRRKIWYCIMMWTAFIWLRTGTSGGLQ
jgi:hypothetical protein